MECLLMKEMKPSSPSSRINETWFTQLKEILEEIQKDLKTNGQEGNLASVNAEDT